MKKSFDVPVDVSNTPKLKMVAARDRSYNDIRGGSSGLPPPITG